MTNIIYKSHQDIKEWQSPSVCPGRLLSRALILLSFNNQKELFNLSFSSEPKVLCLVKAFYSLPENLFELLECDRE